MHEYSITGSIIDIVKKNIKGKKTGRVTKINIEITPLSQIEPESVKFYYEYLTKGERELKGAELVFDVKPLAVECSDCGMVSEIDSLLMVCSRCKSRNISIKETDQIRLVSLETKD